MEPNLICNQELLRWKLKSAFSGDKTLPLQDNGTFFCVPLKLEKRMLDIHRCLEDALHTAKCHHVVNWTRL